MTATQTRLQMAPLVDLLPGTLRYHERAGFMFRARRLPDWPTTPTTSLLPLNKAPYD